LKTHGSGLAPWQFARIGDDVVIENEVLVFHAENIELGNNIYVGHQTILKGYFKNKMLIGSGSWIGQQCFFHAAGGIIIGENVGIGPSVKILTSSHDIHSSSHLAIMHKPITFAEVVIGDGCDIGVNAVILPGVTLGKNVQVGAGAVVTKSFPNGSVIAGVPAKILD
jgi:acetyltransferase-like isoleucine patch superfamily enzyme